MSHALNYFSTFSGIGGFELAIRNRFPLAHCVGFSEINQHALKVYKHHFPTHTNYGDIKSIEPTSLPDFNFLFGGFPCQAFSIAGKRRGFLDARGTLFFELIRIIREKKPRLLLLENVKGLLSHHAGATFAAIISALDELGYDCQWQVLNSKNYGVPQNRERVFIIGHLRGTRRPEVFPLRPPIARNHHKQLSKHSRKCVHSIWSKRDSVHKRRQTMRCYTIRRLTPVEHERLQGFPDNWTKGISKEQRYKCLGNAVTFTVIDAIITRLLN